MSRLKLLFATVLSVLMILPSAQPALAAAADDFNITTSPLPVLLRTTPGKTVTTKIRFQNSGTKTSNFKVNLKKFKAFGETGQPALYNRQTGDDYFDWVSFDRTSFTAGPQQWSEVTMTIRPPGDAGFGYYYAVIFSKDDGKSTGKESVNALAGGAAVLVLLDVQAPGERREVKIANFNADKKLYEYLPVKFSLRVHNTGSIHLSPIGSIFITKGSGKSISMLKVNSLGGNVLPSSYRIFNADWNDGFPVFEAKRINNQIVNGKDGRPVQFLKWDFGNADHFRFGRYTAHLLLTYDNGQRDIPLEAAVSFWVLPWKILLVILVLLVSGIAGAVVMYRRMVERAVKRHQKGSKK